MVAMFVNGLGRNEQLHRGPAIDASYQVSDNLAKRFQRRFFRNRPIRIKNCLWWPCLLMDRDEMSNLHRGPSIDASYQVSVHLAEGFQRHIWVIIKIHAFFPVHILVTSNIFVPVLL